MTVGGIPLQTILNTMVYIRNWTLPKETNFWRKVEIDGIDYAVADFCLDALLLSYRTKSSFDLDGYYTVGLTNGRWDICLHVQIDHDKGDFLWNGHLLKILEIEQSGDTTDMLRDFAHIKLALDV